MSKPREGNYFTCTLGQAPVINDGRQPISNVNEFILRQRQVVAELPAVGFSIPRDDGSERWSYRIFTFQDVYEGSNAFAHHAEGILVNVSKHETVALLCPSTADFLFAWLGLMRMGHSVLLLAPQCPPSAIVHLCHTCGVQHLLYDPIYEGLAMQARESAQNEMNYSLHCISLLPLRHEILFVTLSDTRADQAGAESVPDSAVAYLHHTSGTSSGLPKPIPQSHRAAVGVLPRYASGKGQATFTTTPLYHGGIADLFRAWTSNAMIWLFPETRVPITAKNIISCLDVADRCSVACISPPVKFFSSVPYVLQMMNADAKGMDYLRKMDIVGVGGAALPTEIGDKVVADGVNLISRFGSAECGFLMSSHRDYKADRAWQYLRINPVSDPLKFEERDNGTAELVVLPDWPHRAKTNRPDGSYATADLFVRHPSILHAWRYHSRADSQITLITGKKFDPAPLESAIATSCLLDDVLIFGNGHPFPGALLIRSEMAANMSDEDLIAELAPSIEKINMQTQSHARLARNLLVPIAYGLNKLEKSSKGTVLRKKAEETFERDINSVYTQLQPAKRKKVADSDVAETIRQAITQIVGKRGSLDYDSDLFSWGVDSQASIQIRYFLAQLVPSDSGELPLSIVEDCSTIEKLSSFIVGKRQGKGPVQIEDELQVMRNLVAEYDPLPEAKIAHCTNGEIKGKQDHDEVVVLTGVTGALGAHVLDLYRHSSDVAKIYCLVRGSEHAAARARVDKALTQRGLARLSASSNGRATDVVVLTAKLGEPHLGLSKQEHAMLASEATVIMHIAWAVNFRLRLRSFVKDHIAGVQNLLRLALASSQPQAPAFIFCSSVASISNFVSGSSVPECLSENPADASPLGYSRSKWVAEQICARASTHARMRGRIGVFRIGQLSGDSQNGVWNTKEAWPMMLGSVTVTGCLPDLEQEPLAWLPVDVAAKALAQGAQQLCLSSHENADVQFYHVLNPNRFTTWTDLLTWLRKKEDFEVVTPSEWLKRLEKLQAQNPDHPALQLLGHWQAAYAIEVRPEKSGHLESKQFQVQKSIEAMSVLENVQPVDEEYFGKLWTWIKGAMHEGSILSSTK